jgi:hypothetical protein
MKGEEALVYILPAVEARGIIELSKIIMKTYLSCKKLPSIVYLRLCACEV